MIFLRQCQKLQVFYNYKWNISLKVLKYFFLPQGLLIISIYKQISTMMDLNSNLTSKNTEITAYSKYKLKLVSKFNLESGILF